MATHDDAPAQKFIGIMDGEPIRAFHTRPEAEAWFRNMTAQAPGVDLLVIQMKCHKPGPNCCVAHLMAQ